MIRALYQKLSEKYNILLALISSPGDKQSGAERAAGENTWKSLVDGEAREYCAWESLKRHTFSVVCVASEVFYRLCVRLQKFLIHSWCFYNCKESSFVSCLEMEQNEFLVGKSRLLVWKKLKGYNFMDCEWWGEWRGMLMIGIFWRNEGNCEFLMPLNIGKTIFASFQITSRVIWKIWVI